MSAQIENPNPSSNIRAVTPNLHITWDTENVSDDVECMVCKSPSRFSHLKLKLRKCSIHNCVIKLCKYTILALKKIIFKFLENLSHYYPGDESLNDSQKRLRLLLAL